MNKIKCPLLCGLWILLASHASAQTMAGPSGVDAMEEIKPADHALVGFHYVVGRAFGGVIESLQPIYQTPQGEILGQVHGRQTTKSYKTIKAKSGYAVGGASAASGIALDRIRLKFMRQTKAGGLDPNDAYESAWLGGAGGDALTVMGGDGQPVAGIFSSKTSESLGFGFIYRDGKRARVGDHSTSRPRGGDISDISRGGAKPAPTAPRGVYVQADKAPRPSSAKPVLLRKLAGPPLALSLAVEYVTVNLGATSGSDQAFGRTVLREQVIYPRVTLRNFAAPHPTVRVSAKFSILAGEAASDYAEEYPVGPIQAGSTIIVDFHGFQEKSGSTAKTTQSFLFSSTHVKTTYLKSSLVAMRIKVTQGDGAVLYEGDWKAPATR